jgi:hypothetical protein
VHEGKRRERAGVAPCPGGHRDQPVGALLDGLFRELVVDHVVQRDAAIGVHRLVHLDPRAERGDDDGHAPLDHDLEVALEARVRAVHDLVDAVGRGGAVGVGLVVAVELLGDAGEPAVELVRLALGLARVERGEGAGDAGLALGEHQIRGLHDEHRRADRGQAQVLKNGRQGHAIKRLS